MTKKIFAFNLKMNIPDVDFASYVKLFENTKHKAIVCAPFVYLSTLHTLSPKLLLGAQNVSQFDCGAHTGEVSSSMLKSIGVKYSIVGHSERRKWCRLGC